MFLRKAAQRPRMFASVAFPGMNRMPCIHEMVPSRAKLHEQSLVSWPTSRPTFANARLICVVPEDCVPTMSTARGVVAETASLSRPDCRRNHMYNSHAAYGPAITTVVNA